MHWFWRAALSAIVTAAFVALSLVSIDLRTGGTLRIPGRFGLYGFGTGLLALSCFASNALCRYLSPRKRISRETRCRKCGYILRGLTQPRCPECGERI